ncbi:MAG: ribosome biogenesis GTPase Der [Bdellovibrionota bacterium]
MARQRETEIPEETPLVLAPRKPLPVVAIVGRRNVGKSTLFNRLVGSRKAIVEPEPGVTRDRHYERVEHYDRPFLLVDTGGLSASPEGIEEKVSAQTRLAIEEADLLLFVVDATAGLTAEEREIFPAIRKRQSPVLVVGNKSDVKGTAEQVGEFYELGVDDVLLVSAEHGRGLSELIEAIESHLPEEPQEEVSTPTEAEPPLAVAVVGRPNVGKSTLINQLLGKERLVVSPIAGTTRDPIDLDVELKGKTYRFIDTAGLRRKGRIVARVERYSALAAFRSVERADVAILLFDASEGLTEQDRRIAGMIEETGRALILAANKWDLMPKEKGGREEFESRARFLLSSFAWAPLVEISAERGTGLDRLVREIERVGKAFRAKFQTSRLNDVLQEIIQRNPPPSPAGHPIKLNYLHQVATGPPTFMIYTNRVQKFPIDYRRYLSNQLRERLELECVPVHLKLRSKHKNA